MLEFLSSAKLWLIGAGLALLLFGLVVWRAFAKGQASAQADIAIAGLNKAIQANAAKRSTEARTIDDVAQNDPNNRDTWR